MTEKLIDLLTKVQERKSKPMTRRRKTMLTVILLALLTFTATIACGAPTPTAQSTGQAQTEQAFGQQSAAVPYPADQLTNSLERQNLRDKLLRTNDPAKIGYVYLTNFGTIFGYYTVKGKVSSNQSQMTTDQLIINRFSTSGDGAVVNAPGDDGSYGPNEPGIFFFTTSGTLVTTDLNYIWSDQPLPLDVPRLDPQG